jgi:hypothetical protein
VMGWVQAPGIRKVWPGQTARHPAASLTDTVRRHGPIFTHPLGGTLERGTI